jgi:ubiquinone biosynthesis protein UbiJ
MHHGDELCELFPEPEFAEATGVLEVINQTPEQNELYSSKLKFLLDEASRLDSTRGDALKEVRLEGKIELIQTLQRLLDFSESTEEELSGKDETQLQEISEELQRQLRIRSN